MGLGGLAAGPGAVALVGWWLGVAGLTSILPGAVTMKATTALGMIALGSGLVLLSISKGRGTAGTSIRAISIGLALLALLSLGQDLSGVALGIDEWIARPWPSPAGVSFPGRMSPSTAVCFVVAAVALWGSTGTGVSSRRAAAVPALGLSIVVIGALTLAGHGLRALAELEAWSPAGMAVPTAFGFLCAGASLLALAEGGRRPTALDPITLAGFLLGILVVLGARQGAIGASVRMLDHVHGLQEVARQLAEPEPSSTDRDATRIALLGARARAAREAATATVLLLSAGAVASLALILVGLFVLDRSVAEREELIESHRASEARTAAIVESTMDAIVSIDAAHRIVLFNPAAERMFGVRADDMLGRTLDPLIPERSRGRHREDIERFGATGGTSRTMGALGTVSALRVSGEEFPAEASISQVATEGEKLYTVVLRDVTERERTLAALRRSEERFGELAENIDEVFWSADPRTGEVLYVSPAYERIWRHDREELYRDPGSWIRLIHPDDRERMLSAARAQIEHAVEVAYRIVRTDGDLRWIRARVFPVPNEAGEVHRVVGVAEDITQRRSLEEQFQQAQKMEAVGRLAGGVAHDFNNLLTVVAGYGSMLLDELPEGGPERESAAEIVAAAERASLLTSQLLAFSRQQVLDPKVLDLNEVVAESEKMLRRLIGEDVSLGTSLDPALGRVRVDPGQLVQVLLNLAVNARDAMREGGHLTIETRNVDLDASYVAEHAEAREGPHVLLAVVDSGSGMTAEVRSRVLDPFFTTKPAGHGTGLGLSVVHGIVRQSGGHIGIYSEPGVGTSFKIYLPAVDAALDRERSPAALAAPGDETVLLVEDDDSVRRIAILALRQHGYEVLEARDGTRALEVVERHGAELDLLVTDVVMPGLNGRELATRVRERVPAIRVLFVSGYTDDAIVRHGVLEDGVPFLQKPFTPHALAAKVRSVLDAPELAAPEADGGAGDRA